MSSETGIMKIIFDILKEKPFVWIVLFLGCTVLLFTSFLEFLGSNLVSPVVMAFIRILLGTVWVISGIAVLCSIAIYFYKRIISFAKTKIFEYVEMYCNRRRAYSTLGYLSPFEYEKQALLTKQSVH